ncbi:MAG: hypothetical protein AAF649_07460 [Verrucomicrobiota bacterium]
MNSKPQPHHPDTQKINRGEDMNVRAVHEAIVRELPDPRELYKQVPWYLRHFYIFMLIGAALYLLTLAGEFDWKSMSTPLERLGVFQ